VTTQVTNTAAYPYSTIVRIVTTFADGSRISGTGVIVGDNDVLTAAHMVYDGALGAARTVVIYPALNGGSAPFGSYVAARVSYIPVDQDGDGKISQTESAHDVAVLGFSQDIDDRTGRMGLDPSFGAGTVSVTGYPGVYGGIYMMTDSGSASVGRGIVNIGNLEVNPGNSGGPIWYMGAAGPEVVGIVSTADWAWQVGGSYYTTVLGWISGNDDLLGTATAAAAAYGTAGNDSLTAAADTPLVHGLAGNDTIDGAQGDDHLYGDEGDDTLRGLDGDDQIYGGDGNDSMNGNAGDDTLYGGFGNDVMLGGRSDDLLYGEDGNDFVAGNIGDDIVYGGNGNDTLYGGRDNDLLLGGFGADFLSGDLGDDTLTGNSGPDIFAFGAAAGGGADVITDFSYGSGDRIALPAGTAVSVLSTVSGAVLRWAAVGGGTDQVLLQNVSASQVNLSTWVIAS
jgi:Ca2+-binding RTX toxin-like protein